MKSLQVLPIFFSYAAFAAATKVTDFVLIDTTTGRDVEVLNDGYVLDLSEVGKLLSVRAQVSDDDSFIMFELDGGKTTRVERVKPYVLAGKQQSNDKADLVYYASNRLITLGPHTLKATPQSSGQIAEQRELSEEEELGSYEIAFSVVDGIAADSATVTESADDSVADVQASPYGFITGDLKVDHKVVLGFTGPIASETATTDPGIYRPSSIFADYKLDLTISHVSGHIKLPCFYTATTDAATTHETAGIVWLCHFRPSYAGNYTWHASFRQGMNVAANGGGDPGGFMDNAVGSFTVAEDDTQQRRRALGGVDAVIGVASPNLLSFSGFDNSENGTSFEDYESYYDNATDPDWGSSKGVIGALNFLKTSGITSAAVTPVDAATHPFVGPSQHFYYDVSKLAQWDMMVDHAEKLGVQLIFGVPDFLGGVEETTVFVREMAARFSHSPVFAWGDDNEIVQALNIYKRPVLYPSTISKASELWEPLVQGSKAVMWTGNYQKFDYDWQAVANITNFLDGLPLLQSDGAFLSDEKKNTLVTYKSATNKQFNLPEIPGGKAYKISWYNAQSLELVETATTLPPNDSDSFVVVMKCQDGCD